MTTPHIPPLDAELALAEVRARRDQVVTGSLIPAWYWGTLGVALVGFVACVESGRPWLIATGTILFTLAVGGIVAVVAVGQRAAVRNDLLGVRGGLAIAAFVLVHVGGGLALGRLLELLGVPWPATVSVVPVAVSMTVFGPLLMRHLRRVMLSRPLDGDR
jgi:hypothetical protein